MRDGVPVSVEVCVEVVEEEPVEVDVAEEELVLLLELVPVDVATAE